MSIPKLSEAIRLGAMLSKQAIYSTGVLSGACGLQAAIGAIGRQDYLGAVSCYVGAKEIWPWSVSGTTCPECSRSWDVAYMVMHLNDVHRWTRERQADWVATIEQQLEPQAAVEEVAHVETR